MGKKAKEKDLELINEIFQKIGNITRTAKEFCKIQDIKYTDSVRRKVSKQLKRLGLTEVPEKTEEEFDLNLAYEEAKARNLNESKYYIVTWEQNQTPIHTNLWKNILAYKEFLGAELSVILGRYTNPTSVFTDKKNETWNEITRPYWDANRHDIHKYLTILSDVKIQPTAKNPLTGFEGITGEKTCIIGHPKMHLKALPVLEGHPKKILMTTGTISLPNYTDSRAGKTAEFNHKLGFVIVEVKNDEIFFIRHVEATSDGNFIDLYNEVKDGVVSELDKASAIVWGDTHIGDTDDRLIDPTNKLIEKLNIPLEVHHDLADGYSVNNHIQKNPFELVRLYDEGKSIIDNEFKDIFDFLDNKLTRQTKKIIVQANHNDRFDRYLISKDWKEDIPNSKMMLKLSLAKMEGEIDKGVLAYVLENWYDKSDELICLDNDDSYQIEGFEVAHHAHIGANGSRGSIEQFRRLNTPVIVAHSHVPVRLDNALSVGTSTHLRLGYNVGMSNWLQAHIIIHKNKTAQHIIFVNGEFTTFI